MSPLPCVFGTPLDDFGEITKNQTKIWANAGRITISTFGSPNLCFCSKCVKIDKKSSFGDKKLQKRYQNACCNALIENLLFDRFVIVSPISMRIWACIFD